VKEFFPRGIDEESIEKNVGVLAAFDHPALLRLRAFVPGNTEVGDPPAYVRDFASRGSVADILSAVDHPDGWDDTCKLIVLYGVAAGMLFLKENGVGHRNLTAGNVLLTRALEPKIADFGGEGNNVRDFGRLAHAVWSGQLDLERPIPDSVRVTYRELVETCFEGSGIDFEEIVRRMGVPGFADSWVDESAFNRYRHRVSSPRVHQLERAAEGGDTAAQVRYAQLLRDGDGVERDKKAALHYFQLAANSGDPAGMAGLGLAYELGDGLPTDRAEAAVWYKLAMTRGSALGTRRYATMLENGHGVDANPSEAAQLFKTAADAGDAEAQVRFGQLCEAGLNGVPANIDEAIRYYEMAFKQRNPKGALLLAKIMGNRPECAAPYRLAADHGNQEAQLAFAEICELGKCRQPVDLERAVRYYLLASGQGSLAGMHAFARMLEQGQGTPKEFDRAVALYKMLMVREYPPSIGRYGWLLVRGEEMDRDLKAGRTFLLTAASLGDSDSDLWLGELAAEGIWDARGRKQPELAFQHFQKAANAGNRQGMFKYIECLLEGIGCRRDALTAVLLYRKMIDDKDDTEAMVRLGMRLMTGKAMAKDVEAGKLLLQRDADAGNTDALALLRQYSIP
jgi:TPR repeat protein